MASEASSRERRAAKSETGRLETFADGVMAIAITLLILDVRVPPHAAGRLGAALLNQWPAYVGYVVSFLTVGIMWVNHHRMFTVIGRTDHWFLMLNVLFLMGVAFVPFPTTLVADALKAHGHPDLRIAALTYGATMVAMALLFNAVWLYASGRGNLLSADVDAEAERRKGRSYLIGPPSYLLATLLAFVSPAITLGAYAALAVFWMLPGSGPGA